MEWGGARGTKSTWDRVRQGKARQREVVVREGRRKRERERGRV